MGLWTKTGQPHLDMADVELKGGCEESCQVSLEKSR